MDRRINKGHRISGAHPQSRGGGGRREFPVSHVKGRRLSGKQFRFPHLNYLYLMLVITVITVWPEATVMWAAADSSKNNSGALSQPCWALQLCSSLCYHRANHTGHSGILVCYVHAVRLSYRHLQKYSDPGRYCLRDFQSKMSTHQWKSHSSRLKLNKLRYGCKKYECGASFSTTEAKRERERCCLFQEAAYTLLLNILLILPPVDKTVDFFT